ncbi:MAG: hypothetical protein Fur0040_02620 [Sideroxydans sp.]
MTPEQRGLLERLKVNGRLPAPKGIALEIISLTQKDDVTNHDLVRLISADPAMTQRLIKAANVLLGSHARPVATIGDAVSVLGLRALRQLVLGIALVVDYRHGPCADFNYLHFWTHSLLTAIAVRRLAQQQGQVAAEEIFVVGLLHRLGELALASVHPESYAALLQDVQGQEGAVLLAQERQRYGFDHDQVTAAMLADMYFPELFQRLAQYTAAPEDNPAQEASREWQLQHLLHTAALLARACLADQAGRAALARRLRQAAATCAVPETTLAEVITASAADWREWAGLFGLGALNLPDAAELLAEPVEAAITEVPLPVWPQAGHDFKLRVLVVEDDRAMRTVLEKVLAAAGHRVVVAADGRAALELVRLHKPQVVITDWVMPGLDGPALCRELRRLPDSRNLYLILLTAQSSAERLIEAFEAGADDYLVKPLTPKIFFARLRAAQRVVQLQEELAFDREQLLRFSHELSEANQRLQRQALTDALTGLPNRRHAIERLEQEWALTVRGERKLSCLMVDIDHFKAVNDRHGHQVGDLALKQVADILRRAARTQDVVCRYGGEEFLVICPDTPCEAAVQCAERLRLNVAAEALPLADGATLDLTISIGVGCKDERTATLEDLLIQADNRLYAAKAGGRNRVVAQ